MNAIALLLGLLALSYLGGMLRGGRAIAGVGLPSGAEYVCLGFVLGRHVLGVISEPLLASFEPLLGVGAAWLTLVAGLGYARPGERLGAGNLLLGVISAALVALSVTAGVWFMLPLLGPALFGDRALLAAGLGIVSCASTGQAVRWVTQRYAAEGPLSVALADYARASSLVPMLGASILLAALPGPARTALGLYARVGVTWSIGAVLGLCAVLLVGRARSRDEIWGVLVGTSLLAMGVATELGLSSLSAVFSLGLCLGLLSTRAPELREMVRPSEHAVFLPLAVLAGALVNLRDAPDVIWLIPLGLVLRGVAELVRGGLLALSSKPARAAGPLVGLGLLSMGEITLACAISLRLSVPSAASMSIFLAAIAGVLAGELVGPLLLRRALRRAGEITVDSATLMAASAALDAPRGSDA